MVPESGSNVPVSENVQQSFHSASTPITTPTIDGGYFTTDLNVDLYEEDKKLHGVLGKWKSSILSSLSS
jgi:hypothetical protein